MVGRFGFWLGSILSCVWWLIVVGLGDGFCYL